MRFEDLIAWQKARGLTKRVYQVTRHGSFARDFGLAGQIQRAAVSVMSNIAEGFERAGDAQFRHFLLTAKGSCAELRTQLYVALDAGYLDEPVFTERMSTADEVARLVAGLRMSVERKQNKSK